MGRITDSTIINDLKAAGFTPLWFDVGNLTYGGLFVRAGDYEVNGCPEWFDVLEITDLDSACGADGQVLITARTTSFSYGSRGDLKRAVNSCGGIEALKELARRDKAEARLMLAGWLCEYGVGDPAGYGNGCSVATVDRQSFKLSREPWENTVEGWGMTAFRRAVNEGIRMF